MPSHISQLSEATFLSSVSIVIKKLLAHEAPGTHKKVLNLAPITYFCLKHKKNQTEMCPRLVKSIPICNVLARDHFFLLKSTSHIFRSYPQIWRYFDTLGILISNVQVPFCPHEIFFISRCPSIYFR